MALIDDFADFVSASPSSYHAANEVARRLDAAGYARQDETDAWDGAPGGHYIVRDGAVVAYVLPEHLDGSTVGRIVGTHTDSPGFKLKPHPAHASAGWAQVGMEVYGGPLYNSWLDQEFGLAGRVVTRDGAVHLVSTPPWLRIPQLAPHLDRTINDSLVLDPQTHLMPVAGVGELDVMAAVAGLIGCEADDIAGHDLFANTTQPPAVIGLRGDLFASRRLDNLTSVYAGLTALLAASSHGGLSVLACFDHEEVGSSSRTGACGPLLEDVLRRILAGNGADEDARQRFFARSWVVSADAGHSVNPNYAGKTDPDEQPIVGAGPMVKTNAKQRYTTDAAGEALWARLSDAAGVPHQTFVSNNAVPCGSTIGPLTAVRLGIRTVDVGVPLLSMHSTRELCGVDDLGHLATALGVFFADPQPVG